MLNEPPRRKEGHNLDNLWIHIVKDRVGCSHISTCGRRYDHCFYLHADTFTHAHCVAFALILIQCFSREPVQPTKQASYLLGDSFVLQVNTPKARRRASNILVINPETRYEQRRSSQSSRTS